MAAADAAHPAEASVASLGTAVRPSRSADAGRSLPLFWLADHSLRDASFGCERCMTPGLLSLGHLLSTEVQFAGERIVSPIM